MFNGRGGGRASAGSVDFCRPITQGAAVEARTQAVADRPPLVAAIRPRTSGVAGWAIALALAAGALIAFRLELPPFFDNEGRYAEVAREMVVLGDYVTPHLDFALFLNKPPLVYWLAALVFHLLGPSEWARLVSVAAGAVALFATCRLGALLYGEEAGIVAGVALMTSVGFVLEARTLRPDMLMTAAVVVTLWCWRRAVVAGRRRTSWLAGMYAALGTGMLTKGLVPVVVVAIPLVLVTLRDEGWWGFRRLRPALGLGIVVTIVLPWHLLAGYRHAGFLWDYVVNQHLLFFLDRKLPRDSSGDSLAFFLAAWVARATPWVLLIPLTLGEAARGARRDAAATARATAFLWTWAGGLLAFFSCAPSRLEHYSMPALPAVALLAARVWQRARRPGPGRGRRRGRALRRDRRRAALHVATRGRGARDHTARHRRRLRGSRGVPDRRRARVLPGSPRHADRAGGVRAPDVSRRPHRRDVRVQRRRRATLDLGTADRAGERPATPPRRSQRPGPRAVPR